ncbi:hypothetical protein [Pseudorhodoplanes sp.]|uniref:hypothetical protein n=1 Tax=Pseudorhodoplanes sp. TaxID=1934341 RepID=UPI00391B7690
MSRLPEIPLTDLREGGPLRRAKEGAAHARALRDDCLSCFPKAVAAALPMLDGMARRWLSRSQSPYVREIEGIAAALGFSGVWFLNGSYSWGCTTMSRDEDGEPWLVRTLDWPFPGLGRHVEIARQSGQAGEFYSVTWPGYVGTLTAMAPGRFGAAINQAPLWRRTRHPWLRVFDLGANAVATWHIRNIPPDQLLREVFETCPDFASARDRLERTPVARPVIYSLAGIQPGERCVIERTEEGFETRQTATVAANDWHDRRARWEARVGGDLVLTCRFEDAGENSRCRREAIQNFAGSLMREPFGWLAEPVNNRFTRLAVEMCPARGLLRVMGLERTDDSLCAKPVTAMRELKSDNAVAA